MTLAGGLMDRPDRAVPYCAKQGRSPFPNCAGALDLQGESPVVLGNELFNVEWTMDE
jgi:hypothetical protein